MRGKVEQPIDFGDRDLLRTRRHFDDLVPGPDLALLQHPHVESGPVVGDEQRRHQAAICPRLEVAVCR